MDPAGSGTWAGTAAVIAAIAARTWVGTPDTGILDSTASDDCTSPCTAAVTAVIAVRTWVGIATDTNLPGRLSSAEEAHGERSRGRWGPVVLAAIRIESTHTIDIDRFVPRTEVDERYLDTPYYLAPADRVAQEAFAIIREAMRKKGVVGIARVVLQKRERILMLEPFGKGLLASALRYANQVRTESAVFEDILDVKLQ